MGKTLQPTYGNFTLRGQISWIDRKNAYVEDTSANGFTYRRIRFGVKTAEKNIVEVELFATKFDKVSLQNIETKALDESVPYGEHTGELPDGYRLFMPVNLGIEQDEDGENVKTKLIAYDAAEYIHKHLKNGDTVFMFGSPRFSTYEKDGNEVPQVVFEPRGIYKSNVGYGEEEFKGESTFDQQIVIRSTEKKGDQLLINAFIITDKKGNFVPHRFVIDINKFKKFAMNVNKLKFGTLLTIEGLIQHTVEEVEVQADSGWGESPKGAVERVRKSLEVTAAKPPKKDDMAFYSKEDFVKKEKKQTEPEENPFKEDNTDDGDDWGTSTSSSNDDDPFSDDFE